MKVHIINLEPEEDHASARDKIARAHAPKIVLVWPRRGRPLSRQLDLAIVQRYTSRLGREIGLVTFDPEIINHAQRLQIPVFDSLEKLPSGTWNEPHEIAIQHLDRPSLAELREAREANSQSLFQLDQRGKWIAAGISIAAVLAIVISIFPSADIVMEPVEIPLEEKLSIWIDPQPSTSSSRIPGQVVASDISGTKRVDTSGRVRLPLVSAVGELEITNLAGEELTIPAGTGLRAGDVRFLTTDETQLDASENSTTLVSIEAAEPGASGNVAGGTISSVEGPLGFQISVSNPDPTHGGRDQIADAVSMKDLEDLRQELEAELMESAERELKLRLDRGYELVPGSIRITEVLQESFDLGSGEAAESVGLSLSLNIEGLGYSTALALEAAEQELLTALPENRLLIPDSLSIEAIDASSDWPAIEVEFAAAGTLAESIDRDTLRRLVLGDPKAQAAARLEDLLELDRAPMIQTSPSWMPWLPWLGMRIDVKWTWESS